MNKVVVYYSIENGGDGSAYLDWYETQEDAEFAQEYQYEGWAEDCSGSVETFEGSDIHRKAIEGSIEMVERKNSGDFNNDEEEED